MAHLQPNDELAAICGVAERGISWRNAGRQSRVRGIVSHQVPTLFCIDRDKRQKLRQKGSFGRNIPFSMVSFLYNAALTVAVALLVDPTSARTTVAKRAESVATSAANNTYLANTNVGTFQGQQSSSGATVREWLGIRYGMPTNGSLRFRPPQRASILPRGTVYNATSFSPSCPQNRGAAYTGFNLIQPLGNATDGEDCLSLNIWSPSTDRLNTSSSGTAVMIWIYGGAFTFGTSNTPGYNGDIFVRDNDDVTIVTINYRTNAFGFPAGSPALSAYESNIGLKDQRLAIEWVIASRNFYSCIY